MSLPTKTTQEISDGIISQLEASIGQDFPLLPKSFSRVLAKVMAGVFVLLYKYAGFIFLQLFVAHASMRETVVLGRTIRPLVELGRLFGLGDPYAATRAELVIDVAVETQVGTLATGAQLIRSSTQVLYVVVAGKSLNAPTVQVTIRAEADPDGNGGAGSIGNLEPGDTVEFVNPLPNVKRVATVASVAAQGSDAETADQYRARVVERVQARPQGGAYADYRVWAKTVAGILNVYPYTGDPGEVDVYCEATVASSGSADGIPTNGQLQSVATAIELTSGGVATRRPVGAAVNVLPITRTALGVQIVGLVVDDEATAKAAVEEGLAEYMLSREPYIVGLSVLPREDRITAAAVGGVVDSIVSAYGGSVTDVKLLLNSVEIPLHQLGKGEKAKLATPVNYV